MTADIATLDKQIKELIDCKPLTEAEVEALCDKVRCGTSAPAAMAAAVVGVGCSLCARAGLHQHRPWAAALSGP